MDTTKPTSCIPPWQAIFPGVYVLDIMWGYWMEVPDKPGASVIISYVVGAAGAIIGTSLVWLWARKRFKEEVDFPYWSASYSAYLSVFAIVLGIQVGLLLWHKPDDSLVWMVGFAAISAALAAGWMWISVGYPGMYQPGPSGIPQGEQEGLLQSIRYELEFLKTVLQALIAVYGFSTVALVLGFANIELVIAPGDHAMMWFISGATILLGGLHLSVTGPIATRYMRLVKAIRDIHRSF